MNTTTKDALGSEHPSFSNAEAYSYTFPQSVSSSHPLSTYSDSSWGSQMGHTVTEGSFLPLFNNHSMSGKIFFWSDGFIAGPIVGLEKTSLSSCEAEICSTDEACKLRLTSHNIQTWSLTVGSSIGSGTPSCPKELEVLKEGDALSLIKVTRTKGSIKSEIENGGMEDICGGDEIRLPDPRVRSYHDGEFGKF